ncbi:hypothetical protein NW765_016504 [Fusarium oxysporum]|nr:hypothetical protein NW765_016504 [Fusarium oxysporum]KAJ4263725.1 hypothetical protein NW764_016054 [Fusarium oxysporum]
MNVTKFYKYADLRDKNIRIIHLQPGDGDSTVFVEISRKEINDPELDFKALSWQWGNEESGNEKSRIRIRNKADDGLHQPSPTVFREMDVRPNLLRALKRLRNRDQEARLWVDYICINQDDSNSSGATSEKSKQISMMTEIYTKAKEVMVWLGEPGHGGDTDITEQEVIKAVNYIKDLGNLDDLNHIASVDRGILDKAGLHDLEPVFKLLRRGWFSRRWIVQEVAVARAATLQCGDKTVSWKLFSHAVALLERVGRDGTINRMLKLRPGTLHVSEYVGNVSALPAYRLVQNTSELYRERGPVRTWERTLEQLVCFLAAFQASDPRDTIYAILGIASDFKPQTPVDTPDPGRESFAVDYNHTPLHVFKRFLNAAIAKSKSLDVLCRPWAPMTEKTKEGKINKIILPSWIPSLAKKPFQADRSGKMVRYNPDPLVGPAISRLSFFTASAVGLGGHEKDFFKIDVEDEKSTHINLRAFQLGTIDETWDSAVFGNIPASWLEAGKWADEEKLPPEELWRTMVANRTDEGNDPDPWYPRAFYSAIREKGLRYGINTHQLIHEKGNAAYSEVFRRVQAVVWNRRLIRMKEIQKNEEIRAIGGNREKSWGPLGLAPEEARRGDWICIVLGCSVPLVLRPLEPTQKEHTELLTACTNCSLVGECYIDKMMDGQALRLERQWEDFTIV